MFELYFLFIHLVGVELWGWSADEYKVGSSASLFLRAEQWRIGRIVRGFQIA
jgi:hypothetical protein